MNQRTQMGLLAAIITFGLVGCTGKTLDDEWIFTMEQESNQPLRVVDYLPRPGSPGVPKKMQPYFFFNKSFAPTSLEFEAFNGEGFDQYQFEPLIDGDEMGLRFIPEQDWSQNNPSGEVHMSINQTSTYLVDDSPFTLPLPEGRFFNTSTDFDCIRFGGDPSHADQLDTYMEPGVYPLYLSLVEGAGSVNSFPATVSLYTAPGYVLDSGRYKIYSHIGFATPVPDLKIDAHGYFEHHEAGTFFPLDTPDQVLLLYLVDVRISGRFTLDAEGAKLVEYEVSGVLPTRFLRILSEASMGYAVAVSMLDLDVDLNGNGTPDSATFTVRSRPTPVKWDEVMR